MAKYEELIDKLFIKYVKPKKLPPRLAGQIKIAMEEAAKKSKGDTKVTKAAVAAYLTERGYDPTSGAKLDKPKKVKKEKAAKVKKTKDESKAPDPDKVEKKPKKSGTDPAKEKLEAAGAKKALKGDPDAGVPKGNIDLRKLNRQTMRGMAKDMGLKSKKKWSDDELRSELAKLMTGVEPKVMAEIAKADPAKIDALSDCIGVLLDLSKAICITCPAQEDCRKQFEAHRADGFKIFKTLQPGSHEQLSVVVPTTALVKKKAKAPAPTEPAGVLLTQPFGKVKDLPAVKVDGVAVASNMEHREFLRALKSSLPTTYGDFKKLVFDHYDAPAEDTGGDKLATWFHSYCVALGIFKV